MAKGEQKRQSQQIEKDRSYMQSQLTPALKSMSGSANEARDRNLGERKELWGQYGDYAKTGGMDDNILAGLRGNFNSGVGRVSLGNAGYDEFAKTGGYSDRDIAVTRNRATSPLVSMYGNMKDEMARRNAVQGGYTPGFSGGAAKLARQAGQQLGDASLNAELGLQNSIRAGRQYGISGQADLQKTQADINSRADLTGLGLQQEFELGLARNKLGGLEGRSDLYKSAPGEYNAEMGNYLQGLGITNTSQANLLNAQQQMANMPGVFDKVMKGIGTVGGVAGGLMTGGASTMASKAAAGLGRKALGGISGGLQGLNPTTLGWY